MGAVAMTYEQIVSKVEQIIRAITGEEQVAIWPEKLPQNHVGFVIVSKAFADMTQVERQKKLWTAIREQLGADAQQVGAIIPRTPDEVV